MGYKAKKEDEITKQGNVFNAASQLVKLKSDGKLPILDGSNLTGITATLIGLGNVDNIQQMPLSYLDTDNTLAADSDTKIATQKAIKTYVDTIAGDVEAALDAILGV